jgi:hypothetical protein
VHERRPLEEVAKAGDRNYPRRVNPKGAARVFNVYITVRSRPEASREGQVPGAAAGAAVSRRSSPA